METCGTVTVSAPVDVERARAEARRLARALGFDAPTTEAIMLATIELATNLIRYAPGGAIRIAAVEDEARGRGIEIVSTDAGPGIDDLERALADGFSSGGGLGSGLPAVRRLMRTFAIESSPAGTRIVARAWPR